MKPTEAAALLTIAAAFDNRKPDADQAKAWALALDGLRFEDCRDAIVDYYRQTREWLMPSNVCDGVKKLRARRLSEYGVIVPPAHIDPDDSGALKRWLQDATRAIGDGTLTPLPVVELEKPDVIAELGHIGQAVSDA